MDAADFLDADELAQLRPAPGSEPGDACEGCAIAITWVDAAFACAHGCTWCPDCAEAAAWVCATCSQELRRRPPRARPLPRR